MKEAWSQILVLQGRDTEKHLHGTQKKTCNFLSLITP